MAKKFSDLFDFDDTQLIELDGDDAQMTGNNSIPEGKKEYYKAVYDSIADATSHQEIYGKLFHFLISWAWGFSTLKTEILNAPNATLKTRAESSLVEFMKKDVYYEGVANQDFPELPGEPDNSPKYDLGYLVQAYDEQYPTLILFSGLNVGRTNDNLNVLFYKRSFFIKVLTYNTSICRKMKRDGFFLETPCPDLQETTLSNIYSGFSADFKSGLKLQTPVSLNDLISNLDICFKTLLCQLQTQGDNLIIKLTSFSPVSTKAIIDFIFDDVFKTVKFRIDDFIRIMLSEGIVPKTEEVEFITNLLIWFDKKFQTITNLKFITLTNGWDILLTIQKYFIANLNASDLTDDFINKLKAFFYNFRYNICKDGFEQYRKQTKEALTGSYLKEVAEKTYDEAKDYPKLLNFLINTLVSNANKLISHIPIKQKTPIVVPQIEPEGFKIQLYSCWQMDKIISGLPGVVRRKCQQEMTKLTGVNSNVLFSAPFYWDLIFRSFTENKNSDRDDLLTAKKFPCGVRPVTHILDWQTIQQNFDLTNVQALLIQNWLVFLFPTQDEFYFFTTSKDNPKSAIVYNNTNNANNLPVYDFPAPKYLSDYNSYAIKSVSLNPYNISLKSKKQASPFEFNQKDKKYASYYERFNMMAAVSNIYILGFDQTKKPLKIIGSKARYLNFNVFYGTNGITSKVNKYASWESTGFGNGSFRADAIEPEQYIWLYEGESEYDQLGIILGLSNERALGELQKKGQYSIRSMIILDKLYSYILNTQDSSLYIETLLPKADIEYIDDIENPLVQSLQKIKYFRKITFAGDPPNSNNFVYKKSGGNFAPNNDNTALPIDKNYIGVHVPKIGDSRSFRLELRGRKKIKNKGSVLRTNTRQESPGKIMGVLVDAISNQHQGLKNGLSKSSLSATTYASKMVNQISQTKNDWQELKVQKENRMDSKYSNSQEWCHLIGAQLGGEDRIGNLVSGSAYCNTEQLAFETAIRSMIEGDTSPYRLMVTAYLFKNEALEGNFLSGDPIYYQKAYSINQSLTKKKSKPNQGQIEDGDTYKANPSSFSTAPVAAFIRYKLYRDIEGESKVVKIIDHTLEGQSEFLDKNQYKLIEATAKRILKADVHYVEAYKKAEEAINAAAIFYTANKNDIDKNIHSGVQKIAKELLKNYEFSLNIETAISNAINEDGSSSQEKNVNELAAYLKLISLNATQKLEPKNVSPALIATITVIISILRNFTVFYLSKNDEIINAIKEQAGKNGLIIMFNLWYNEQVDNGNTGTKNKGGTEEAPPKKKGTKGS